MLFNILVITVNLPSDSEAELCAAFRSHLRCCNSEFRSLKKSVRLFKRLSAGEVSHHLPQQQRVFPSELIKDFIVQFEYFLQRLSDPSLKFQHQTQRLNLKVFRTDIIKHKRYLLFIAERLFSTHQQFLSEKRQQRRKNWTVSVQ